MEFVASHAERMAFIQWVKDNIKGIKPLPFDQSPDGMIVSYRGVNICLLWFSEQGYAELFLNDAAIPVVTRGLNNILYKFRPARYGTRNWITNNGGTLTH